MGVDVDRFPEYVNIANLGALMSGTQAHYANGLDALFLVTGQDSETSIGFTRAESSPPEGGTTLTQAQAVAQLCLTTEEQQKQPQDIEWAFDEEGYLWHLQNHPIASKLCIRGQGESRLTVLDNSNIVESYPGLYHR